MSMNLTTDPWVPIVWADGQPGIISLRDAFTRAQDIRDLAVPPHERIALMRLLICIAQAALDGPAKQDDWKALQSTISPAAGVYLTRWHNAFELFGDGQRFLQVDGLKMPSGKHDDQGNSASKLDLALATGNNSTLFDNAGFSVEPSRGSTREFTGAQLALMLLTYQCFSPGGTIGVALWNNEPTPGWKSYPKPAPGQSNHAPCLPGNMLHALVQGASLAETLRFNLLTKDIVELALGFDKWGKPVWEAMPSSPNDNARIDNAVTTYLGRLVPLCRAIHLEDDCRSFLLANALSYPAYPEAREPSATVIVRNRNGGPIRATLGCSLDRAPWRELHSLTVKRIGLETNGGPLTLQNVSGSQAFDLWVGSLVADKAKPLDTLESIFHVPSAMLTDPGQRAYEKGVRFAEDTEFRLRRAVAVYHKELGDDLGRAEFRARRQKIQNKGTAHFWTNIEQGLPRLLDVAVNPGPLGPNNEWPKTDWGKTVWQASREAYELACPHTTPRQMRAYALGLNTLRFAPKQEKEAEA